ncbi:MAG TPA: hypothetical protein VM260_19855, partial [Pirellula sp.]|nr:hypothetical protein [Pirellula sp.]
MFQIRLTATTFEFDAAGYNRAMRQAIENHSKLAAREFAKAALQRIPIRTGFVAGAFGTLTDLVGGGARLNPIVTFTRQVLRNARDFINREGRIGGGEYYYPNTGPKVRKTSTSGRQFATQSKDIFKWDGDKYIFNYEVDISYFRINDQTGGRSPTAPWRAFEAAELVFVEYM